MFKLNFIRGIFVLLLGFLFSISSSFADYPNKPIKLYIGYKAGGGTDTVGRVLAKVMSKELGQQVQKERIFEWRLQTSHDVQRKDRQIRKSK